MAKEYICMIIYIYIFIYICIYICIYIFIFQAAGAKKGPADPDSVSNTALRSMCESVLQLVTTTIDIMEGVSLFLYFYVLCSFSITAAFIYS